MPVPSITTPHRRTLLREGVYERLREAIVDGTLAPGEKLKDTELETWLDVSRTPIREAIQRLERDGLVATRPNKSTIVTQFNPVATKSTWQVVSALHELAAQLALPHLGVTELVELERAHKAFEAALDANDADAALHADDDFHAVFVNASGNPVLAELLDQVTPVLRRVERMRFQSNVARESITQHASILDAARRGDATEAARMTRENWQSLERYET